MAKFKTVLIALLLIFHCTKCERSNIINVNSKALTQTDLTTDDDETIDVNIFNYKSKDVNMKKKTHTRTNLKVSLSLAYNN
jgi:hypothetical protein